MPPKPAKSVKPVKAPRSAIQSSSPVVPFDALDELLEEIARTYQRLVTAAEMVHEQWGISAGQRGLLRTLYKTGPQNVPQMARIRCVSRQFIQTLVNPLLDENLVTLVDNPAHQRSKLVALTPKGRQLFEAMEAREQSIIAKLPLDLSATQMQETTQVLRRLRAVLEGPELNRATDADND